MATIVIITRAELRVVSMPIPGVVPVVVPVSIIEWRMALHCVVLTFHVVLIVIKAINDILLPVHSWSGMMHPRNLPVLLLSTLQARIQNLTP